MTRYIPLLLLLILLQACKKNKTQVQEDELYSRHLQRKVQLTVLNTPLPDAKEDLNLLVLNDGQDFAALRVREITDSLYKAGQIRSLLIVAVKAGDRMQEYGVAGKPDYQQRGSKADQYSDFINNELYPYIKKKSGVRKFHTAAIAGWSLGGLSAFDIAWDHEEKFDKAGIFSGSFWWRNKDAADSTYDNNKNRIILDKLKNFRKARPQQFWFYCGSLEENSDRDKDGVIDVQDDIEDLRLLLMEKNLIAKENLPLVIDRLGKHDTESWSRHFPDFLIWAFGK